ncbi:MAG: Endonuclease/exonuclease/phosphatase family protein, partial [uncultured Ramlibacter sp.]
DGQHPQGLHHLQPQVHAAGTARRRAQGRRRRGAAAGGAGDPQGRPGQEIPPLAGDAALRVHGGQHLAAQRLWPERRLPQGRPRQRRDVQISHRALPEPRRVAAWAREAGPAALRVARARPGAGRARDLRAPGPVGVAPRAAAGPAVRDGAQRGARQRAAGGGGRLQRLALPRQRFPAARDRPARGLRQCVWGAGQDLSLAFPLPVPGPHLRAQCVRAPSRGPAAKALVPPLRSRAAGGRDPPV